MVTTAAPVLLDLSDLDALLEDSTLDAEGRANAVNAIVAQRLEALGFTQADVAGGKVVLVGVATTLNLADFQPGRTRRQAAQSCATATNAQKAAAQAAAASALQGVGSIVTASTYCTDNSAGGATLQVEMVIAVRVPAGSTAAATTAAAIAQLQTSLAAIPGVIGFVVEEVSVANIVDALSAELKIFALVEDACVCARDDASSAKGGKKGGKSSKGGTTGGVTITLLREGSGSGDSGSDMQGRMDAAVTSIKKGKSANADSEMREEDGMATSAKSKKAKSSKGVVDQMPNRMRRKGGKKSGKSSKGGTTGGVTITLLREGSGSGDSGSDMQGRVDATVTSKKGKKGADSENRMDNAEMKMAKSSKKSSKSVKEGRVSPTCVCDTSSGKSKKSKKGESAAFAISGLARGQKASFVLAGIAGAMAVVGVAVVKARSNRLAAIVPSESDPLLSYASAGV
jgi:hypothetical protein